MNQKGYTPEMLSPTNLIALYTFLSVLLKIKQQLGLEAMLEYAEAYRRLLESHNPKMKDAVRQALEFIDVNKIYGEIFKKNDS